MGEFNIIKFNLESKDIKECLLNGNFGLEEENLRIDKVGYLSDIKHPFLDEKQIDRDFCESQVEFITTVKNSTKDVLEELKDLHTKARNKLWNLDSGREFLWPFSNPPCINSEEDIPIAKFTGNLKEKEIYRNYLSDKYGKRKMLYSGIHYNFSFSDELLKKLYKQTEQKISFNDFKNNIYLKLSKKVTEYTWLIVYLTAASSVADPSLFTDKNISLEDYASYRCSEYGYWNYFTPILNYSSLEEYVESINKYVENEMIYSASELYYPVRLKCAGVNDLDKLNKHGINHIELRMIDLNPLDKAGIMLEDLDFLHYMLVYFLSTHDIEFTPEEQIIALNNEKNAAHLKEENINIKIGDDTVNIVTAGLDVLNKIERFYKSLGIEDAIINIEYQKQKLLNPKDRYAYQVKNLYQDNFIGEGIKIAENNTKPIDNVISDEEWLRIYENCTSNS